MDESRENKIEKRKKRNSLEKDWRVRKDKRKMREGNRDIEIELEKEGEVLIEERGKVGDVD